jgi:hypothetical protein
MGWRTDARGGARAGGPEDIVTFTPAQPPRLIVYSPWLDDQLTTCDLDTARAVSEGEVIRANGKPV